MISAVSLSKLVLISTLSISGLQYSEELPLRMSDEQAISIVGNLLPASRREILRQIISNGTLENLSEAQKLELNELTKEAGLHLANHEKPLA